MRPTRGGKIACRGSLSGRAARIGKPVTRTTEQPSIRSPGSDYQGLDGWKSQRGPFEVAADRMNVFIAFHSEGFEPTLVDMAGTRSMVVGMPAHIVLNRDMSL